jgi:hypothetical protein
MIRHHVVETRSDTVSWKGNPTPGGSEPRAPWSQVGSVNNTFGVEGVEEYAYFMKTMRDAQNLRVHTSKVIEQAALPGSTEEDRRRLLNFVVVRPWGCS